MNIMEIFFIVASGFCMIAASISMYIVMDNHRVLKELNSKLPYSWDSDYIELMNRSLEIENEMIALKDCIDSYCKAYTDNLAEHSRHIIKAVYERGDNTMADIASIMGDHKIEHDDLDKSIEIFTKAVSLATNDIGDVRDDLQIISSNLKDKMESYIRMNADRVEIGTPNFEIDEKVSDITNEPVCDKNQAV